MRTDSFRGRDFLTLLEWSKEEVETILDVALDLKRRFALGEPHDHILRGKTLFMIFYNQSLRTRNSFEAGMTQLGGHAHFLDPDKIYTPALPGKEVAYSTERVSDVARVLSRMGHGIAIRCYGDPVDWVYGGAHELIRNFAYWADIPVLNMECDKCHPFQALADILTVKEKFGTFKGIKFVMSWAYSPSVHKPRAVPQSAIIAATMMGCDTVLAHPPEMELDPEIIEVCRKNAARNGASFQITHDFEEAVRGAHVVYPKAWAPVQMFKPPVGVDDPKLAQEVFDRYKSWKATREYMALADPDAIYMHCLPADRGWEVEDAVIDHTDPSSGWRSVVYDQAENRLHVQKAVMALVMR
ncbi:MAG: ornithine carbamoyltransferase [Anaerolineae bacterium]|nr:ornithine carbamoyltransferase [Anaerolineae bacterium]